MRKIFDVNVVAALGYVQQAHRAWMGEHGGAVVNLASVAGIRSTGVIAAYGASKAALIRLTEGTGLATGTEDSCQRRSSRDRQDAVRGSPGRCRRGQGVGGLPDEAARHPRGRCRLGRLPRLRRGGVDHGRNGPGRRRSARKRDRCSAPVVSTDNSTADVVIVGGGPAGRALATRCIARQLTVVVVDPHPHRVWTPTLFGVGLTSCRRGCRSM